MKQVHSDLFEMMAEGQQSEKWTNSYKVVYTSRTHSQLAQAMKELKVTEYKHLKGIVLGSRDQLCINEDVLKDASTSSEKVHLCRAKIKSKTCNYHRGVEKALERPEVTENPVLDIEDLVKVGKTCNACPYYMSKTLSGDADIVFLPYNYVLDPKLLKSFALKLGNSIVILDEGHNVEKVCQDAASVQIASSDIATCTEDITHIMKLLDDNERLNILPVGEDSAPDFTIEDCAKLKEIVLAFEQEIDKIDQVTSKGRTFPGGKVFEYLNAVNINQETYQMIVKIIESMLEFLTNASAGKVFARKGFGLLKLSEFLGVIYGSMTQNVQEWKRNMEIGYRLHVEIEEPKKKWNDKSSGDGWQSTSSMQSTLNNNAKVLNYWCFNPGFGMANLTGRNVHSIILTSGTLAPLKPLISELALDVNQSLENPHIIQPSQVFARIIPQGPDGTMLNANYQNRDNKKYIHSLGMTIKTIANFTPNGLLVFFPSYLLMNKMRDEWQSSGMWNIIHDVKPIFSEPRKKEEFDECMNDYYTAVKISHGAIFMAVLRGKVSEGLDFKDENGRAVIIIGLPFPPYMDPRVVLKKEYLETNRNKENQLQTGQDWYNMEATRAVNQAIGRVIRHKDDYGAIFLCDQRFYSYKNGLSRWIQSHIKQAPGKFTFGPILGELNKFFRYASQALPKPVEVKQEPVELLSADDFSVAKFKSEKLMRNQIKIENSNEIYGGGKSQQNPQTKSVGNFFVKQEKPRGFLGGLGQDVKIIDFNNSEASTSTDLQIFSNDSSKEYEAPAKKRKLKMAQSNQSREVSFVTMLDPVRIKKENFDKPVPENRVEFMNVVS